MTPLTTASDAYEQAAFERFEGVTHANIGRDLGRLESIGWRIRSLADAVEAMRPELNYTETKAVDNLARILAEALDGALDGPAWAVVAAAAEVSVEAKEGV